MNIPRVRTLLPLGILGLSLLAMRADAGLFAPSSVSSSAIIERVKKEHEVPKVKTTRKVTVSLYNMSPTTESTVGIECWMFYKNLATDALAVQHQQKSVWRMPSGHRGEVTADEALFEYTPLQFKVTGVRRGLVRKIPASGHKYYGFVVRIFENGRVINEISSDSKLPALTDQAPFDSGSKGSKADKYNGAGAVKTSVAKPGAL
jgi:hypothetical protein